MGALIWNRAWLSKGSRLRSLKVHSSQTAQTVGAMYTTGRFQLTRNKREIMTMKSVWILPGLVLSLSVSAAQVATPEVYAGDAAAGKVKSASCAGCHGVDGNSMTGDFPKLAGQHASYLQSSLVAYKSGSRNNALMMGIAMPLSDTDMAGLAAYFASQSVSPGAADPAVVTRGEQLYRFGDAAKGISACAACHGPAGAGMASAGFPAVYGQWTQYTTQQLQLFRDGVRINTMMNGVAVNMLDADMTAVASYIEGLR